MVYKKNVSVVRVIFENRIHHTTVKSQTAVNVHFSSEQLLPYAFLYLLQHIVLPYLFNVDVYWIGYTWYNLEVINNVQPICCISHSPPLFTSRDSLYTVYFIRHILVFSGTRPFFIIDSAICFLFFFLPALALAFLFDSAI